jgi:hypothetical protein
MLVNRLVIFLIPPKKIVNGGIMSIFSLCKESRSFLSPTDISAVSVFPGKKSYRTNDLFENNEYIYEFAELLEKYPDTKSILLHIPEYSIKEMSEHLSTFIPKNIDVSINVLDQNIDMMPSVGDFSNLMTVSSKITQTTAHAKYATQDLSSKYATPLLHLSVYIDKEQYKKLPYESKDPVILFSPDGHISKTEIIESLKNSLPNYQIKEIKNLTYSEYKQAVQKARYVITFGEGLDGYLIESCFSGTVAFSTYNERFFPSKDFLNQGGIYKNYDVMLSKISGDIKELDNNPRLYTEYQNDMQSLLEKIYDKNIYKKNLKNFYSNNFTYYPTNKDRDTFIANALKEKNELILGWKKANLQKDHQIEELKNSNKEYVSLYDASVNKLASIQDSMSWKATGPLRAVSGLFRPTKRR